MRDSIFLGLVNNAALLLALWAIYCLVSFRTTFRWWWEKVLTGLAIGVLGIAVMFSTLPFSPGVVFDTRSILLSISGLFFGLIPSLIAAVMTAAFRIAQGGMGTVMGITVIFASTVIGLGWRYLRNKHDQPSNWLELYLLGIVVHVVMLLASLTLPSDMTSLVLRNVSVPVMVIYPLGTVALGILFSSQLNRKNLGQELEKSEAKYRNIVETAEEGICSLDNNNHYVFFNRKFAAMLGYSGEEFKDLDPEKLLTDQAKELIAEKRKNRKNGIRENYDLQMIGKTGNLIWFNVSANPTYDADGNYSGALAMYTDITDRVRLQEELRKSEEYYRILYQQSPLPYQSLDTNGCFKDVNQVWLESLGYSKDEVIGEWFGGFLTDDEKGNFTQRFSQFQREGEIHDVEFKMRRNDGDIIYVSFDGRIGINGEGEFNQAYCVWRDVSQIRKAQQALTESETRLRALANYLQTAIETERAHIAREIHDEFGQLMTGLKMDLAWCKRNNSNNPLLASRFDSMDLLVNDAIKISRRLSSELRPGLLDDLGLIPAMEWYVGEFTRRSDIKCQLECPENEPALNSDVKTTVFRIFQEALTNIARHAEATSASIQLSFDDGDLILEVRDDGRGITSQELNNSQSLGLLGIQERARQKGGSVDISGLSGHGTTVIARFPFTENTEKEIVP